jgi:hypothetical protein
MGECQTCNRLEMMVDGCTWERLGDSMKTVTASLILSLNVPDYLRYDGTYKLT